MPWNGVKLNSGDVIPQIGFGTWKIPPKEAVDQITQAVHVGVAHIDTAQNYGNEAETGQALKGNGLPRRSVWITTKFSGRKSVEESIKDSLNYLGVKFVDLYLIHGPPMAEGNIPGLWEKFEKIQADGSAKNIGVSNFNVEELELLLRNAQVVPAVNQILLHPYIYAQQKPIIDFCHKNGIAIEAYSPLIPITKVPGGPVDEPLQKISKRTNATYDQILLAWNKAKGSIVLSSSSKRSRLEGYMKAGDIELTEEEIAEIDAAGAKGSDSWFIEDVVPNSNSTGRTLTVIILAAVSLTATIAVWAAAHILA